MNYKLRFDKVVKGCVLVVFGLFMKRSAARLSPEGKQQPLTRSGVTLAVVVGYVG